MGKDSVRAVQTLFWVCLILFEMMAVCRMDVRAETVREVEQEVWYEAVEGAETIPEELIVTVSEHGREQDVVCDLVQMEAQAEEWQDGFLLPVTFHVCDADWYQVGDRLISRDEALSFEGYESYLLAEAGLSAQEYRITELIWDGESYLDENGEECRDAFARGWKLVRDFQAVYRGIAVWPETVPVPETEPETAESEERESEEGRQETEMAAATGAEVVVEPAVKEEEDTPEPGLIEKIVKLLLVAIGAAAVWFLLGILILIVLRLVKCGKECYNKKKRRKQQ